LSLTPYAINATNPPTTTARPSGVDTSLFPTAPLAVTVATAEVDDDAAEALLDVVKAALPVVDLLVVLIEPDIDVDVVLAAPALVELDIIVVRVPPMGAAGAEAAATPLAAAI